MIGILAPADFLLTVFQIGANLTIGKSKNTRHASSSFGWEAHPGGFLFFRGSREIF